MSALEDTLASQLTAAKIAGWEREHQFAKAYGRKWRLDFAFVADKIGIEIDGGVFTGGRHVRGAGVLKDMEKANAAVLLGWRVLRFSKHQIEDGSALATIEQLLAERGTA